MINSVRGPQIKWHLDDLIVANKNQCQGHLSLDLPQAYSLYDAVPKSFYFIETTNLWCAVENLETTFTPPSGNIFFL